MKDWNHFYSSRLENALREVLPARYVATTNSGRIALKSGLQFFLKRGSVIAIQSGACRAVFWAVDEADMRGVEFVNKIPKGVDAVLVWR